MESVTKDLAASSISPSKSTNSHLRVFAADFKSTDTSKDELLQELILASQDPESSTTIYEMLLNDATAFVKGLRYINDSRGIILVNIVPKSNSRIVENIVNTIKDLVKEDLVDSSAAYFYLSLYFGLLSTFETVSNQLLSIFLSTVNPVVYSNSDDISTLLLLVTIKHIKADKTRTIEVIGDYLNLISEDDSPTFLEVVNFIKLLEIYFPILPEVIAPIYMADSTKNLILDQVKDPKKNLSPNQKILIIEILKLISSSCINDQCRTFNATNFLTLLQFGTTLEDVEIKLFSTLAMIKIWNFVKENRSQINELLHTLAHYVKEPIHVPELLDATIEGLAYLSLNPTAKNLLRDDINFIESIIKILSKTEAPASSSVYGLFLLLANLSQLKSPQTEKTTLKNLKSYAAPGNDKTTEDQQAIHLFNKSLLMDYKILDIISKVKTYIDENNGSNLIHQALRLIFMISLNPEKIVRQELVKQGALNFILDFLVQSSVVDKSSTNSLTRPAKYSEALLDIRTTTLRSLAKLLVSINPQLAFKKYDLKTPIPFLIELLGPDISNYTGITSQTDKATQYLYEMTNLDKFESLLALTNLSSCDDSNLKKVIISKTFDIYLNNFIIDSDNPYIQKASWELISNLITEPSILAKFFHVESPENLTRLKLLVKLLNSKDASVQIVLAGLLANATSEFGMIPEILILIEDVRTELTDIISGIFTNQATNDDLVHRICFVLLNMVIPASSNGKISLFQNNKALKDSINHLVRTTKSQQVLEILKEVIKIVRFN